jgi:YVTN family beta-propeller protein
VKRSSSAIAVTSDGRLLLVVNPDSNSLSLVDLEGSNARVEIPVGADPRTVALSSDERLAYTANRGAGSLSVIDLKKREVVADVQVGPRPYGVVASPDGRYIFVTVQGHDRLAVLDAGTWQPLASIPLGDRPSGLAVSESGDQIYITHLLGNQVTLLTAPESVLYFPLAFQTDSLANAAGKQPGLASFGVHFIHSTIPLWPDSNLVQAIVIGPDGGRAYLPHTRSNSINSALTLDTTVFPIVSVIDLETELHLTGGQYNLDVLDPPAVGLPFDAALTPDGDELWIANAASNDVTVIELATGQLAAHIEVGANPRGIVGSPDGNTFYVNNTLAGTVSVIDAAAYTATHTIMVTAIALDPVLLQGKRLFYSSHDPRMGQNQWMSCSTCHFDGEHDGQTWQLGFAGPRNTSSLLGMVETLPLRWSGEWDEAADAEFAIRMDSFGSGLIPGPMMCTLNPPDCASPPPHSGLSADLDALAAFINSLAIPLSPDYTEGQPLSEAAARGRQHFNDPVVGCATCHLAPLYTDNLIHDVGTVTEDERIGPAYNTPSLLGIYDSAPYFHDGSAWTLLDVLSRPSDSGEHDVSGLLTSSEIQDLIAFLLSLPFEPLN